MARSRSSLLAFSALSGAAVLVASPALALEGTSWRTASGDGIVRLATCNTNQLCGSIQRILTPGQENARDAANPNAALRNRPIRGLQILSGFQRNPNGRWTGGRIYDPNDGRSYRSELRLLGNGNLEVKGCIGPICQAQIWTPAP